MNFNKISEGFGSRFKEILKSHKVTQSKFGDDTNTHKGLISRYINGESPSGDFIMKVVAYFPEDIMFLFFGNHTTTEANEPKSIYKSNPNLLIEEIEDKLRQLKSTLSQK